MADMFCNLDQSISIGIDDPNPPSALLRGVYYSIFVSADSGHQPYVTEVRLDSVCPTQGSRLVSDPLHLRVSLG